MRRAAFALLVLGLATLATPAHAYRLIQNTATGRVTAGNQVTCSDAGGFTHWNTRAIAWRHNTALQGAGAAAALQASMASWTNVADADHVLTYAGTTASGWATDGQNTILWANGNGCTGNCLALTALVLQAGQVIVESDVTFNNNFTWNTNGNDQDVQAVATHELGHALGIHHTELNVSTKPTMFATYFGTGGRTLETDDRSALQCSEWRYCVSRKLKGDGGGYFAGRQIGTLYWNGCLVGANVDVFKDGVKILTTPNDGVQGTFVVGPQGTANYWVCDAGSTTWYNSATCTNVITLNHFAP
jgi:hypothetical protein